MGETKGARILKHAHKTRQDEMHGYEFAICAVAAICDARTLSLRAPCQRAAHTVCSTCRMSPVPTTRMLSGAAGSLGGCHCHCRADEDEEEEGEVAELPDCGIAAPAHCASSEGVKPHIWLVPMPSMCAIQCVGSRFGIIAAAGRAEKRPPRQRSAMPMANANGQTDRNTSTDLHYSSTAIASPNKNCAARAAEPACSNCTRG